MPYQYKIIDWDIVDKYVNKLSPKFIEYTLDRLSFVINYLSTNGLWEFVETSKDRNGKPIFIFKRPSALEKSEQDEIEMNTEKGITNIELGT